MPLPTALFLAIGLGAVSLVWDLWSRDEMCAAVDASKLGHGFSPVS
jgi:hypothetical protein